MHCQVRYLENSAKFVEVAYVSIHAMWWEWVRSLIKTFKDIAWWRHQMGTFSALLAICAGNSPVPGEFPTQRPVMQSFDVFFDLRLNKRFGVNNHDAGDLRHYHAHDDVIVMSRKEQWQMGNIGQTFNSQAKPHITIVYALIHLPRTKWPPFRRRYFQMHFREWKVLYFDENLSEICS